MEVQLPLSLQLQLASSLAHDSSDLGGLSHQMHITQGMVRAVGKAQAKAVRALLEFRVSFKVDNNELCTYHHVCNL